MIWTAWSNGSLATSGAGYGFRTQPTDRDRYFNRLWSNVVIEFPSGDLAKVNANNRSFWDGGCQELRGNAIGAWRLQAGHAPWTSGQPLTFDVEPDGPARFRVTSVARP